MRRVYAILNRMRPVDFKDWGLKILRHKKINGLLLQMF